VRRAVAVFTTTAEEGRGGAVRSCASYEDSDEH
jgi:hypothetical protein